MKAARKQYESVKSSWLKAPDRPPLEILRENLAANRSLEATTLAILAHHGTGDIKYYKNTREVLNHQDINAVFRADSIVMLNGCGTAVPTESEILRRITDGGVGATFATTSVVDGSLAGSYFHCLAEQLSAMQESRPLSLVHFNALRCLYTTKAVNDGKVDGYWRAHAFKYVLLGNGNLQ